MAAQLTNEYVPTQWVDGTAPAINALHLNHLENGVKYATDGLIALEAYDMQGILDRLTALESRCTTLEGEVNTLQGQVTTLEGEVNALQAAPPSHTHPISQVVDLQTQLNSKPTVSWSRSGSNLYIDIAGS